MSGHGDSDCIHLTELGAPAFVGFGLEVPDDDALDHLAFQTQKKVDDTNTGEHSSFLTLMATR